MRRRDTTTTTRPDPAPDALWCPHCDSPLVYRETVFGGVQPPERWDYYTCHSCGTFQYRPRTRRLRVIDAASPVRRRESA
jgi:RNase P subunit RPR2